MDIDEKDVLDAKALEELYMWIDAVPLTRPKKNIARDFSDGVLAAEIVHFYLPRAVDLHNYVVASSTGQKKINWNTLNRKVFCKMNIKLNDTTLNQVVEAKPGAIEQVLWDLRRKIMEHGGTTYGEHKPPELTTTKSTTSHAKLTPVVASSMKTLVAPRKSGVQLQCSTVQVGKRPSTRAVAAPPPVHVKTVPSKVLASKSKVILPPDTEEEVKDSFPTELHLGDVPSQIVFRGHKMFAAQLFEAKEKEIKELENAKKQLTTKVRRMEAICALKDGRIEDLTHQLSNIRQMYEHVTQRSFFAVPSSGEADEKKM